MPKLPTGLKITKKEVSQRFNLKEIFEKRIGKKAYLENRDEIRNRFLGEVINFMENRTVLDNVDRTGKPFREYNPEYAKKKGLSPDEVNMKLKGKMLKSIHEREAKQANIGKIAVGEGVNTLKAFNHNTGDTLPKRQFFGVRMQDVNKIANEIASDLDGESND